MSPLEAPQPIARLAALRILAPLAILGFLSSRIAEAPEWIGQEGFFVPDLAGADYHQPLFVPRLATPFAWAVSVALVASGLAVSAGFRTRASAGVFGGLLAFVALSDRISAFTVSKLGAVLMIALSFTCAGARYSVDAYLASPRTTPEERKARPRITHVPGGEVRFFQVLVVLFYTASGIAKMRGDWLKNDHVFWTLVHDSYQTWFSWVVANHMPAWGWTVLQGITLVYELGAPIWYGWEKTRRPALGWGLAMHLMIGLMFGPVIWFSLLMMTLLIACFVPIAWLEAALGPLEIDRARHPKRTASMKEKASMETLPGRR